VKQYFSNITIFYSIEKSLETAIACAHCVCRRRMVKALWNFRMDSRFRGNDGDGCCLAGIAALDLPRLPDGLAALACAKPSRLQLKELAAPAAKRFQHLLMLKSLLDRRGQLS